MSLLRTKISSLFYRGFNRKKSAATGRHQCNLYRLQGGRMFATECRHVRDVHGLLSYQGTTITSPLFYPKYSQITQCRQI